MNTLFALALAFQLVVPGTVHTVVPARKAHLRPHTASGPVLRTLDSVKSGSCVVRELGMTGGTVKICG